MNQNQKEALKKDVLYETKTAREKVPSEIAYPIDSR